MSLNLHKRGKDAKEELEPKIKFRIKFKRHSDDSNLD